MAHEDIGITEMLVQKVQSCLTLWEYRRDDMYIQLLKLTIQFTTWYASFWCRLYICKTQQQATGTVGAWCLYCDIYVHYVASSPYMQRNNTQLQILGYELLNCDTVTSGNLTI